MPTRRHPGFAPVVFDDHFWSQDLARTSTRGRGIATATRRSYERKGCPIATLRRCDDLGRDGTRLPGCAKVYLPPPSGPFGMVFLLTRTGSGAKLALLAFGVRHQPRHSNAPSVYTLAHQRLHACD